jgi:hypothetical protein
MIRRCRKWQYPREKPRKQDVTRDAPMFGSLMRLLSADAPTAASLPLPTEFARAAVITRVFR